MSALPVCRPVLQRVMHCREPSSQHLCIRRAAQKAKYWRRLYGTQLQLERSVVLGASYCWRGWRDAELECGTVRCAGSTACRSRRPAWGRCTWRAWTGSITAQSLTAARALTLKTLKTSMRRFDRVPIAAASLGQVHLARLDGQRVVVKVQRPGLKELFDIDLKNLRVLAQWLQVPRPAHVMRCLSGGRVGDDN